MIDQKQNIKTIFSGNLRVLMQEKGISRKKVCSDLGVKYTTFCDWVNGRTLPREDQLGELGEYFGLSAGNLFIEINGNDAPARQERLKEYVNATRRLAMSVLDNLSDEQIRELIRSGFTFEHRTLEEYVKEAGGRVVASDETVWGGYENEVW